MHSSYILEQQKIEDHNPSQFEKLPKNIQCLIFGYLDARDLSIFMRINKYYFNLFLFSSFASQIWKEIAFKNSLIINENEINKMMKNLSEDYERNFNKYYLYFKYGVEIHWSETKRAKSFEIIDKVKIFSGPSSWNTILGEDVFTKKTHYIESITTKMDTNCFIFFGVGSPNVMLNGCCTGDPLNCWVAGNKYKYTGNHQINPHSDEKITWNIGDKVGCILDFDGPSTRIGFLINGHWKGWKFDKIPNKELYVMICMAYNIEAKLTKHIVGRSSILRYVENQFKISRDKLNIF
eukprot:TRINITY_DN5628_c0_g1_i1.p1 TRINITY_DN5628_c0_g1~~TRINITY_DN5628_c0_g1_i1.p1  ORF type:complete len:293 (-),score=50.71 TRINITY_DN5628_c0_g1_i1:21-899(-)